MLPTGVSLFDFHNYVRSFIFNFFAFMDCFKFLGAAALQLVKSPTFGLSLIMKLRFRGLRTRRPLER